MLSVICPIYNEEKYIRRCIESILKQNYPQDDLEVIFADGMSSDKTREIVREYIVKYPWIKLIDNPQRVVPPALNKAIRASRGDIIMRLDAHASYPANYFSTLVTNIKLYDADNIGAVCKTDVINHTTKTEAIKAVLSHPLGVGNSSFRTGIKQVQEVDTVPFGCWKRTAFDKFGMFDERLIRNQDIEFNKRINRGGGKIIITPYTYSTYYARETFGKLANNNYGNGKWNILTVWYTRQFSSLSFRHFIPLIFILSLIIPLFVSLFWHTAIFIALASLTAYAIVILLTSAIYALKRHLNWFFLVISFLVLHISYGWGSLVGIIKLPFVRR